MKLTMLLLTGIGLILCIIAFIVLVIIFIINDIKEHKVKMEKYNSIDALLGEEVFEMDARTNCERVQALEQEIDNLKKKLNAVAQDFYRYVQGGEEICVFCLHNDECEPGETLCGATYKGFKSRWLNEREDL